MVRFSDMLGGDGEPEDAPDDAAADELPPIVDDESPEPDDPPAVASAPGELTPQELLDRLTQYATATRSAEPAATDEPGPDPSPSDSPREQTGDDLLPRAKRSLRNPRGKQP